jgi:hypothetical protein
LNCTDSRVILNNCFYHNNATNSSPIIVSSNSKLTIDKLDVSPSVPANQTICQFTSSTVAFTEPITDIRNRFLVYGDLNHISSPETDAFGRYVVKGTVSNSVGKYLRITSPLRIIPTFLAGGVEIKAYGCNPSDTGNTFQSSSLNGTVYLDGHRLFSKWLVGHNRCVSAVVLSRHGEDIGLPEFTSVIDLEIGTNLLYYCIAGDIFANVSVVDSPVTGSNIVTTALDSDSMYLNGVKVATVSA